MKAYQGSSSGGSMGGVRVPSITLNPKALNPDPSMISGSSP